ncbi:MAG: Smr/MutS family protein [Chitinophagaceae bacterium]|nr:Smr/MutS family protein [Chitinophagaceae bacterium]
MKYQIGDRILLLHSDEEGEILDIINDKMVMVNVNGVKFPVYTDQIDFPYFKRFSQKNVEVKQPKQFIDTIKKEKGAAKYKVGEGVWLSFLPVFDKDVFDDDIVEKFRLYLVNQTENTFRFTYRLSYNGADDFELKNTIQPLNDFYLHDIPFEGLNDSPKFWFEFSLMPPQKNKADYYEVTFKPKAKQVFKRIEEMRLKQEASFYYPLFETYPGKVKEDKPDLDKLSNAGYRIYNGSHAKQPEHSAARTVVDLHIEKLSDRWQQMSNAEKLDLQLTTFEKFYDLALLHQQHMLIVVHGVGTGKLREEIHDILQHKKEVKSFVNQYHPSFGYGATEIYFK